MNESTTTNEPAASPRSEPPTWRPTHPETGEQIEPTEVYCGAEWPHPGFIACRWRLTALTPGEAEAALAAHRAEWHPDLDRIRASLAIEDVGRRLQGVTLTEEEANRILSLVWQSVPLGGAS